MASTTRNSPRPKRIVRNAGGLTHLDARGRVRMVDVGGKPVTRREAIARGRIEMAPETLAAILGGRLHKGEALAVARVAGIMAAKRTHELIPLCHQLPLEVVEVGFRSAAGAAALEIQARTVTTARTGVEMEAMVAVSAAALAIYDMAKAIDRAMVIGAIRLVSKRGGRSGNFIRAGEASWPSQE
ncbi:MAG TPA: cyclic pyranopterin monophosphate synthase MoaC [Candidatus Binataceae bacterium]|nr:cyclic pyranopterin monophosphate synthase MoaC [Candidatus Binataceae bacterium]